MVFLVYILYCIHTYIYMYVLPQWLGSKNAMQEMQMWVQSLCWEDPLEEDMETHSSILACRIPWTEEPGGCSPVGCKELDTTKVTERHTFL